MHKPFGIELFLSGELTGSSAPRHRHMQHAKIIHAAIAEHWQRDNPWTLQRKHLAWCLNHRLRHKNEATRYHYGLTIQLLVSRIGKR